VGQDRIAYGPANILAFAPTMFPRRTRLIIRTLLLLLPLVLGIAAWFDRDRILPGAEKLWIISDPVGPADAVAVLGGGDHLEVLVIEEVLDIATGAGEEIVDANDDRPIGQQSLRNMRSKKACIR
jgi:hypothetical protein